MSFKLNMIISLCRRRILPYFYQTLENASLELYNIQVRELDKRYTHANCKRSKCTIDFCQSNATHWLTRYNKSYCQSDVVCHQHAKLWMEIRSIIK